MFRQLRGAYKVMHSVIKESRAHSSGQATRSGDLTGCRRGGPVHAGSSAGALASADGYILL